MSDSGKYEYTLSEKQIQEIFDEYVKPLTFRHSEYVPNPVTVLVGAQPAAGKTQGQKHARALYDTELTPIIGDDFRKYHPDYRRALLDDPTEMPDVTKQLSARLVEKCIDYANENGYSTIIEGTWRDDSVVLDTAREARRHGRSVQLVALATKPSLSRIGMCSRYYDAVSAGKSARWTPISAHETVLGNIDGNIESFASSDLFDRYTVIDRTGSVIYDGTDGKAWHDAWRKEFTAPLTAEEQRFVDARSERYVKLAGEYTPERVSEVDSVLSAARSGAVDPLIYVEPYMRNGKPVSGYFRHVPTRRK